MNNSDKVHDAGYAEPATLNTLDARRRAALDEVDNAKFSRFHVKACAVAGVGFFTDAYDSEARLYVVGGGHRRVLTDGTAVFSISIAATMIGYVYHAGGSNTPNQDLGIKVAHSVGTFVGQLLFGWLADVFGRKRMYGIELMIIIIGTLVRLQPTLEWSCGKLTTLFFCVPNDRVKPFPASLPPSPYTASSSCGVSSWAWALVATTLSPRSSPPSLLLSGSAAA